MVTLSSHEWKVKQIAFPPVAVFRTHKSKVQNSSLFCVDFPVRDFHPGFLLFSMVPFSSRFSSLLFPFLLLPVSASHPGSWFRSLSLHENGPRRWRWKSVWNATHRTANKISFVLPPPFCPQFGSIPVPTSAIGFRNVPGRFRPTKRCSRDGWPKVLCWIIGVWNINLLISKLPLPVDIRLKVYIWFMVWKRINLWMKVWFV